MKLLDLFCGAGGAAVGYQRAGFTEITGIDMYYQPNYPFDFIHMDVFDYLYRSGLNFDLVHASPPCQKFSKVTGLAGTSEFHLDYIGNLRQALIQTGLPYVIENVPGAPLREDVMLCGSMFGLGVRRHRVFELSAKINLAPLACNHELPFVTVAGHMGGVDAWSAAMGIDWMTSRKELAEAIPPAYMEYLGKYLYRGVKYGLMGKLRLRPVSFREAKVFIDEHHSHHTSPKFWKFGMGVEKDGKLVGVAMVSKPTARLLNDGYTAEVTRCCTDGTRNVASMLYGAAWRAAKAMGYRRLITYVLEHEKGTSLQAAGWLKTGQSRGYSWNTPSRPREDKAPTCKKWLWEIRSG